MTFLFPYLSIVADYDLLSIGFGHDISQDTTVLNISGEGAPTSLTLNASEAWVTFNSYYGWWEGFIVEIYLLEDYVACQSDEFHCGSGYGCLNQSLVCDNHPQCLNSSDETDCDICDNGLIHLSQNETKPLTSPYYPAPHPSNLRCIWTITSSDDYTHPSVTFIDFSLNERIDFVYIETLDENIFTATGDAVPQSITVAERDMTIRFVTEAWSLGHRGFMLELTLKIENATCSTGDFTCEDSKLSLICLHGHHRCDGQPLCPDGSDELQCGRCGKRYINIGSDDETVTLTSINYPHHYENEVLCTWTILSTGSRHIIMMISEFELEDGFDFLSVGNGDSSSAGSESTIARLTGRIKLRAITSFGDSLWIKFSTDRTGSDKGFSVNFTQILDNTDICETGDFSCGNGICVSSEAACDGFNDCLNNAEEAECAYIACPGSYPCDDGGSDTRKCVTMATVCDGKADCAIGDDEEMCDQKRCPENCICKYSIEGLVITCDAGWTENTLKSVPQLSQSLLLKHGNRSRLSAGLFKGLFQLKIMWLSANGIFYIEDRAFDGLSSVNWLDLSHNGFDSLKHNLFEGLGNLQQLFLLDVPLLRIHDTAFTGLDQLRLLVLVRTKELQHDLQFSSNAFRHIQRLEILYTDDHRLCCSFDNIHTCTVLAPQPPLFNCGSLMQNNVLRVSMWILGISAFVGNLAAVLWRLKEKPARPSVTHSVQSFMIGNLALSDFLMGLYMVILASVDVYYGKEYFIYSDAWRSSKLCKFAGFLSLLSGETSVFFLTLISFDRFMGAVFPFSYFRFTVYSVKVAAVVLWCISFTVSVVPVILAGPNSDFYDLSDVCIGLPLITRPSSYELIATGVGNEVFDLPVAKDTKPAWYFSIAIFLGINLACFISILIFYIAIFIRMKQSTKRVRRDKRRQQRDEKRMAIKMAVVVGTDFMCWVPVIIMGVLSQTGVVVIPLEAYTWSVVFILPINSSLNPYLYTVASLVTNRKNRIGPNASSTNSSRMANMNSNATRSELDNKKEE